MVKYLFSILNSFLFLFDTNIYLFKEEAMFDSQPLNLFYDQQKLIESFIAYKA